MTMPPSKPPDRLEGPIEAARRDLPQGAAPTSGVANAWPGAAPLPDVAIDRASPVPFYFQLAGLLEEEIVTGRWATGIRVASESALCSRYGLSRTTIRQALARLEQEGLLRRDKGRGTFVGSSRPRSWPIESTEGFFHRDVIRSGHAITSQVLALEPVTLPRWASDALELQEGAEGVVVERLRSVDGLVALYVINCLPEDLVPTVLELDADESLYQRLAERASVSVVAGRRSIEAVAAGAGLAELLEVEAGTALAYIQSVSREAGGRPVDCYRAWLRTDRMRIEIGVTAPNPPDHLLPDLVAGMLT